jgi:hypothetical protein
VPQPTTLSHATNDREGSIEKKKLLIFDLKGLSAKTGQDEMVGGKPPVLKRL